MAIVVIGGHSRSVGKTSVVAGLIAAIPERNWTAIKITQYGHGICSADGKPCACSVNEPEHSWTIEEEHDLSGESDTSRFLVAGAKRSLWARTRQGFLAEAIPALRQRIEEAEDVIIESNSVMKFIRPDLYLTILDPWTADFKKSALQFFDLSSAVILHESVGDDPPEWKNISLKPILSKPVFRVRRPNYISDEVVEFVRGKLSPVVSTLSN